MKFKQVSVEVVHIFGHFNHMKKVINCVNKKYFYIYLIILLDIVPDFVTMGKSMGNGFPVSGLMTRREITQKFDINGIEYFNTYGGNPVSCRAAIAVIDVVEKEKLMEHAHNIGAYLLNKLKEIGEKYDIIGDVRGRGLFIGIEIVRDGKTRQAGIEEAREIKYK